MKYASTARLLFLLILSVSMRALAQQAVFPAAQWEIAAPETSGWNVKRLREAFSAAGDAGATQLMVVQHGRIIAKAGDIANRSGLHSCRKSLLSALIGIAVERKQMNLDATLAELHIDDEPPSLTPAEQAATVRQLISARSGVYHAAAYETNGMADAKPRRGSHAPGTFWYYNNWDFNTAGHIYEQAAGTSVFKSFDKEIAQRIGMEDFRAKDGKYVRISESRYPAYTFNMSARDLARFGLLFLNRGSWSGQQIVPAAWVTESTTPRSEAPSGGYGYMWWTADAPNGGGGAKYEFPKHSFWLEGNLGQYAVIVPQLDLVIVTRVDDTVTRHKMSKRDVSRFVSEVVAAAPKL